LAGQGQGQAQAEAKVLQQSAAAAAAAAAAAGAAEAAQKAAAAREADARGRQVLSDISRGFQAIAAEQDAVRSLHFIVCWQACLFKLPVACSPSNGALRFDRFLWISLHG
jgi:hypothetical protein